MKFLTALLAITLALSAHAAELRGNEALVLAAALTDIVSPGAAPVIAKTFNNQCEGREAAGGFSNVSAQRIECSVSNVAIGSMSCIVDGKKISGRKAYELYALLSQVEGVSDGAAGKMFASTGATSCSVDFGEIASCAGGGVVCHVSPAQR